MDVVSEIRVYIIFFNNTIVLETNDNTINIYE